MSKETLADIMLAGPQEIPGAPAASGEESEGNEESDIEQAFDDFTNSESPKEDRIEALRLFVELTK